MAKRKRLSVSELRGELEALRTRLAESEDTLKAIRAGEVDAVVVSGPKGDQVYSLAGAEAVYRTIAQTMGEAAFTVAFDGTILFCNEQFSLMLKQPMNRILGRALRDFVGAENRSALDDVLASSRRQPLRTRLVFQDANGESVPARISSNPLQEGAGDTICIVASDLTELENSTDLVQRLRLHREALQQANRDLSAAQQELLRQNNELQRTREALELEKARYLDLFETAPDGYIVTDAQGRIEKVNEAAAVFFERAAEMFEGLSLHTLLPGLDLDDCIRQLSEPRPPASHMPQWQLEVPKGAGTAWIELTASASFDANGELAGLRWLVADISRRKQAETSLKGSLAEKELLLREVHHRVKNNFQIISSLLNLQSARVKDPEFRSMFQTTQHRLRSMALAHESLYRSADLSTINMAEYLESLVDSLRRTHEVGASIRIRLEAGPVFLGIDRALPCALIAGELVVNAFKHAFPPGHEGEIYVKIKQKVPDRVTLVVGDTGIGLPEEFDIEKAESLGLSLVSGLSRQLNATLELQRDKGTVWTVSFPLKAETVDLVGARHS